MFSLENSRAYRLGLGKEDEFERGPTMTVEKKDKHQYTADIAKLEKELAEFQRQWEQEKKKCLEDIKKIEKKIEKK
jgi:hypothetical protein